jgi:pimeloyl-ACP methyl ester carboxylesterase
MKTVIILFLIISSSFSQTIGNNSLVGKKVFINGINMYYEIYGEGEPLLLLNGNGGSIRSRADVIPELSKTYKVIAIDSRYHGKTDHGDKELNYRLMATDIALFLDTLNIGKVNVWGLSDGGIMALLLAIEHPEKVNRIIVGGANYNPEGLEPELFQFVQMYKQIKNKQIQAQIKLMAFHPNITEAELKSIKIPTLIMVGDRDAIKMEHTLKMFRLIENSNLCVLPATTHFVTNEKPSQSIYWVNEFLSKPFKKPTTVEIAQKMAQQLFK